MKWIMLRCSSINDLSHSAPVFRPCHPKISWYPRVCFLSGDQTSYQPKTSPHNTQSVHRSCLWHRILTGDVLHKCQTTSTILVVAGTWFPYIDVNKHTDRLQKFWRINPNPKTLDCLYSEDADPGEPIIKQAWFPLCLCLSHLPYLCEGDRQTE